LPTGLPKLRAIWIEKPKQMANGSGKQKLMVIGYD
jgi:hypothetical protein